MAKTRYHRGFFSRFTPAQILALFFFSVITVGALLLNLPIASYEQGSIGLINSFFTSTSAVCVTGLVAVDTGTTFTVFGKIVIIILIQFGGMGIMTFATVMYIFLRRQLSVSNMLVIREALNQGNTAYLKKAIGSVALLTFSCEAIGAVLLSLRFIPMYGLLKGAGHSIFFAISAFCNAGFDVNGNFSSLTKFSHDPLVVLTIAALIIMGGIGFAVIRELVTKKQNRRLSLHAKMVITVTLVLLVLGTVVIFLMEIGNPATLATNEMNLPTKIMNAFFQAVTLRTAGFNTIDQAGLLVPTKMFSMMLMFVGASPGSTGGGIKTTTFGIIVLAAWSIIRGKDDITVANRRIKRRQVVQACSISLLGIFIVVVVGIAILSIETGVTMENILYEVFSAFATVGISAGLTPSFTNATKILLMFTMYAGRLGPMTLAMAFAGTRPRKKLYHYVEEDVMIG